MAELHVTGLISTATGFPLLPSAGLFLKFSWHAGSDWELLEGYQEGQTHCDVPAITDIEVMEAVLAHPVSVHYLCRSVIGWPKLAVQVFSLDEHRRTDIAGYGFAHVPTRPGHHKVDIACWAPEAGSWANFTQSLVGGGPRLKAEDVVHTPGDRFRLQTRAAGLVHVELDVVAKDFHKHEVAL